MKSGAKDPFDDVQACVMFKLLRDYELEISGADKRCSVIALAEQFRSIFVRNLSSQLRNLDHVFTLRILKSISSMIQPKELHHAMKLWKGLDHKRVEDFIKFPGILGKLELITHLVQDLAEGYFTGKLPIELSDDEETVLLVNVLQQQPPFIGDNDARSKLRYIFEKAIELYNTLSPEVVDNQNGNKRQKT
ncbi:uncharacterized protein LOC110669265 [Hevea brasiliensis]|uniref:uncharacterized protein LOC110669265 n=1 Tax=Hevea brasiliensis TaxID=3981 RepID=UPI0025EB413A|nr:uncharacterized protein LOC110669265 [Hevea brasiliensis]